MRFRTRTAVAWSVRALALLALLSGAVSLARAQDRPVEVVVEYVAGADIYIDAGRDRGILDGDTILVYDVEGGSPLGTLRVISATADKAVLTFAAAAFPITRGDRLRLSLDRLPVAAAEPSTTGTDRRSAPADAPRDFGPRLSGRLTMDMDLLRTRIRFPGSAIEDEDRLFATPALGLRSTITRLPGELVVNTSLRLAYRYSSDMAIEPETSLRLYEANVGKTFSETVRIQVGRFYNPFERFSGYWDGLLVRVGGRDLGAGFASGFEPDRADEGFTSSLPKYTAFVDYRYRVGDLVYDADISFHQVRPRISLEDHTYFGWAQRLRVGGFRISSDLQVDRDPADGDWTITELFVDGSVPLGARLYLDGRYSRRRPYYIWLGPLPIADRREQAGVGLTYRSLGGFLTADITSNRWADGERSLTYSSSAAIPRSAVLGLGVSASASYWKRDGSDVLVLSPGLTRSFGRVDSRFGYQLYRSGNAAGTVQNHAADLLLSFPLTRRTYSSIGGSIRFGDDLLSQSLRATVWTTF